MMGIARDLIDRLDSIAADGSDGHARWDDPKRLAESRAAILNALREIAEDFGNRAANEFSLWIQRNEVNWVERERWWGWWLLFSSMSLNKNAARGENEGAYRYVQAVAHSVVEPSFDRALDRAVIDAASISLDRVEERISTYDIGPVPEPLLQDVVIQMRVAALRERAFLGHRLIAMVLDREGLRPFEGLASAKLGSANI
jgi:hypothetical protein